MAETIFGIDKGILKVFGLLILLVGGITTIFASEYVSAIILGSIFQTTADGSLAITTDMTTLLGTMEDDSVTMFGYINTGLKFVGALITVVAVILVFAPFLKGKGGKKGDAMDY